MFSEAGKIQGTLFGFGRELKYKHKKEQFMSQKIAEKI